MNCYRYLRSDGATIAGAALSHALAWLLGIHRLECPDTRRARVFFAVVDWRPLQPIGRLLLNGTLVGVVGGFLAVCDLTLLIAGRDETASLHSLVLSALVAAVWRERRARWPWAAAAVTQGLLLL